MAGLRSLLSTVLAAVVILAGAQALGLVALDVDALAADADEALDDAARSLEPTADPGGPGGPGSGPERSSGSDADNDAARTPDEDLEPRVEHGINKTELEYRIHDRINAVRAEHDLSRLAYDTDLRAVSRYHSRDMARNDYFAHTAPDGETMRDRYERYGYDCRVETESGYATGGENLFVVRFERVSFSESRLAEQAVEGWMRSPGHRRNILRPYWEHEAIGVDVVERDGAIAVYVTQHFC